MYANGFMDPFFCFNTGLFFFITAGKFRRTGRIIFSCFFYDVKEP